MPLNTIYYLLLRPTLFSPDFLVVCPPSITSVVVGFVFIPQLHTLNSIQSSYSPGFFWHLSTCICIPVKGNIFIPFHFPFSISYGFLYFCSLANPPCSYMYFQIFLVFLNYLGILSLWAFRIYSNSLIFPLPPFQLFLGLILHGLPIASF